MLILLAIIIFVFIPILEIYIFIEVGSELGAGTVIWLTLLSAIFGVYFVKQQAKLAYFTAQRKLQENQIPANELFSGICILFAGICLILPGLLTDFIGATLLIPAVRKFLSIFILDTVLESFSFGMINTEDFQRGKEKFDEYREGDKKKTIIKTKTIDAEYEIIKKDK